MLLRELLASAAYESTEHSLTLALGKDIGGNPVVADLARMPHLLVAGTTGSGKSVAINSMILSLLYRLPPDQCKLILIDPKMLELSVYDDIPHLLTPVVTEPAKAVVALKWTVREMESRYKAMSKLGVRNISGYNRRLAEAREKGEQLTWRVNVGMDAETGAPIHEEFEIDPTPMPFIVVVVDEMADLMLVAGKDIEGAVQRLAQMARAAGIHLIMATQRPSVDVITGTIKANFPTRISFQVTSKIDSRTILGEAGAEQLLGQGDMLYLGAGGRVARGARALRQRCRGRAGGPTSCVPTGVPTTSGGSPRSPKRPPPGSTRAATRTHSTTGPWHWSRPSARPPPASCSAISRSATTAPPGSSSGWRAKASSARLTMSASARCWSPTIPPAEFQRPVIVRAPRAPYISTPCRY